MHSCRVVRMARRISSRDVWVVVGNALALVALVWLVWRLRTLVSWLLVAVVIALAVEPLIHWLGKHGLKRGWAVLLTCIGLVGVIAGMVASVLPMFVAQTRGLIARGPALVEGMRQSAAFRWLDERVDVADSVHGAIAELGHTAAAPALGVATAIIGGVVAVITIAILSVLAMLFGGDVVRGGLAWMRPDRRARWGELLGRMQAIVGRFVLGELIVASIAGITMGVTTALIGVPYYLALGLIMVLLTLIPYLGSMIGAVLVVGVTFSSEGLVSGLVVLGVYLVYQQIENQVVQPIVQRRTMHINPLLVALALLGGTMLAGIAGALLALPIVGAVQVVLDDVRERRRARWGERPTAGAEQPSSDDDSGYPEHDAPDREQPVGELQPAPG
jgi:putative heme transporter